MLFGIHSGFLGRLRGSTASSLLFCIGFWCFRLTDDLTEERIYQGFPEEVVEGIIKDQERKYERILNGEKLIPFIVILLDDIIAGHDLRYNNELWEHLVFSGRHLFALVILCTQDVKGIGPDTRHNSDIIAMTYQTQKRSIESIEQDYASLLMTSATDKARLNPLDFYKFVQRNTKNHKMLVCDQTSAKYELKEVFFWDQAPDPKKTDLKFKIGDEQFWREAGCDWKAQLKKHKNAPSNKEKDDWKKEAKKRWKKEKEEKSWRVQREESKLEINQPFFADRKYRAMMMEEQKREIGKSHVQQAAERIRNVAKFIPGPKTSDRQY